MAGVVFFIADVPALGLFVCMGLFVSDWFFWYMNDRTRAYLDVNCASCHNSAGRSSNTGLWLGVGVTEPLRVGICKPPEGGQQNRQFSFDVTPGNADASFLHHRLTNYRINSEPPRVAMPELGRHVFHAEGNALVRDWINAMAPGCP